MNKASLTSKTFPAASVICILPRDPDTSCFRETCIQGTYQPTISLQGDETDARVFASPDDFTGSIGGTVIHHEDFKIRECLGQQIIQRPVDMSLRVVGRKQDTEKRVAHDSRTR